MYAKILPLPLDSESVSVLGSGNARQRAALNCIEENDLFACLAQFRGVLASTIALSRKELLASLELGRSQDLYNHLRQDYHTEGCEDGEWEGKRRLLPHSLCIFIERMIANNPQPEFENQNVHKVLSAASRGLELAAPNGADIHRRTNCAQRLWFERENLERRGLTGLTFKELSQQAPDMHTRIMNSVVEVRTYGVRIQALADEILEDASIVNLGLKDTVKLAYWDSDNTGSVRESQ